MPAPNRECPVCNLNLPVKRVRYWRVENEAGQKADAELDLDEDPET